MPYIVGMDSNNSPFAQRTLSQVADSELLTWASTAAKLAAGPLAGDAALNAQRSAVEAELVLRRLVGGPKGLTGRERREMGEGQE